jgi:FkbM family methyltransferase
MPMTITSYAQNFEDIMLWRSLKHIAGGKYIDIGAQDPIVDSVSLLFYKHGWRGLHVEPSPAYAESLRRERPDEIVIQAAVARQSGLKQFYEIPTTGLSTGDRELAESHRNRGFPINEIIVTGVTLEEIFSTQLNSEIHWLKIDVEGEEKDVLESWGDSKVRPWIVLVESTVPLSTIKCHEKWEHLLLERDYVFAYFDGLNRFYVASGHEDLHAAFKVSPNIFDDFALSGKSSSPLTHLLNERLNSLEANSEHERRTVEERINSQIGTTSAKLSELQSEFEQLKTSSYAKQDELQLQLITSSNLLAHLTNDHICRERDLSESVLKTQAELSKTMEAIAARDEHFVSELARQSELLSHQIGRIDQRQHSVERQLLTAIEANSRTNSAITELNARVTESYSSALSRQDEIDLIIQEIRGGGIELQKKNDELSSVYRRQLDELNGSLRDILAGIYSMERRGRFGSARDVIARAATLPILSILSRQGTVALESSRLPQESIFARSVYQRSFIPNPDGRYCLKDFADLYDKDFVRAAYLAILRREPDPDGESYYLWQIRSGEPREKLLGQILGSSEATRHVTVIEGLRLHNRLRKLFELPLLGTLASAIAFFLSIGSHLKELRALDNHVTRIAEESQRRELFNLERLRSLNK